MKLEDVRYGQSVWRLTKIPGSGMTRNDLATVVDIRCHTGRVKVRMIDRGEVRWVKATSLAPRAMLTCPKCGHSAADEDDFDVIGACNDNVFCRQCHCEFDPATGEVHQCDTDAMEASRNRERGIRCAGRTGR